LFGTVGAHAPDEMRLGMNERAEQIVQSIIIYFSNCHLTMTK